MRTRMAGAMALAAALAIFSSPALAHGPGGGYGPMMGQGYGPMMGHGYGPMMGHGYGPMMGHGYGPMAGPGMIGPGMMGYGYGSMMGHPCMGGQPGYMGQPGMEGSGRKGHPMRQGTMDHPGMMGRGMMGSGTMGRGMRDPDMASPDMMGHGMMGRGYGPMMGQGGFAPLAEDLSAENVRHIMEHRLSMWRNPNLKLGEVVETDEDTITADVVTQDDSLVRQYVFDRHTGMMRPADMMQPAGKEE